MSSALGTSSDLVSVEVAAGQIGVHPQSSFTRCTFSVLYPVPAPERGPRWQTHAQRRNLGRVLGSRGHSLRDTTQPGRPRDYSLEFPDPGVHVKRTRFVTLWTVAVPHTTGSFRGDTLVRRVSSAWFHSPSTTGAPLRSTGSGRAVPPLQHYYGRCDSLPSISPRFVSFAWRYHRSSPVRPHQLGTKRWINLELVSRISSRQ